MQADFRKRRGRMMQMSVEALIASLCAPGGLHLAGRVSEYGAEPMLKLNRRAEVALDFINPQLGKIGPNTQDIREIADQDGRHGRGLA